TVSWKGIRLRRVFERGDIVRVCLNPTMGKELQGDLRPVLVISHKAFNELGLAMIAPITQGGDFSRYAGFAISLMGSGSETQGVVLVNMVRSVDLKARNAKFIEKVNAALSDEVVTRFLPIFED
ncbi:MAG: type II toxin-antitoxin system ChpB family toxin, partial [Sulfuriferula sp.]